MPGESVDGQDVWAVREAAAAALDRARRGEGPTLIEARTYRYVGHHEGDPVTGTYRTAEELGEWKKRCPILLMEKFLESNIGCTPGDIEEVHVRVAREVEDAVEFARKSPEPDPGTLEDHVFAAVK